MILNLSSAHFSDVQYYKSVPAPTLMKNTSLHRTVRKLYMQKNAN